MTKPAVIHFDPKRPQDFLLELDVGDQASEEGLTQAQVTGSGRVTIKHFGGEDEKSERQPIYAELNREQVVELFLAASQFDWNVKFPNRPGIPDEAIVEWTLRDNQTGELKRKAWLRDAEKSETMSRALKILRREVDQLSHGRLFL
jgi:hypothetical protein